MNTKKLTTIGVLGAIAVAFGALGAHFLKGKLDSGLISPDQLNGFDTGVKYQMYHTLAMLMLILYAKIKPHSLINWAYYSFLFGIILFSGSLYFLCTRHLLNAGWLKILGPITPIGGLFFIAGWIFIAIIGFKNETSTKN